MVLRDVDANIVAGVDIRKPPRISHEIYTLSGVLGKNYLLIVGSDELRDRMARGIGALRRPRAELVDPAVWIRVIIFVVFAYCVDDLIRALSRRRGVEVNEPFARLRHLQNRKVLPDVKHFEVSFVLL